MINLNKLTDKLTDKEKKKKVAEPSFLSLLLFSFSFFFFFISVPVKAQWVGTGTCYTTCCTNNVCESGSFYGSEYFSTQSACLARLAQGIGICQSYALPQICTVTAFTGACSGSSGSSGASTSAGGVFQNPAVREALSDFAGNSPTAGTGGLSQGFGTNNKVAQEQGEPSFTKHVSSSNEAWQREAAARMSVNKSRGNAAISPTEESRMVSGAERAANFFTAWISPSKTVISPLTGDSVPRESAEYQMNYINEIKAGGQAISGVGITPGAKDALPPSSPETPKTPQVQGRVQMGASACRDTKWLFNSATQMCYPNLKSCEAADTKGICQ